MLLVSTFGASSETVTLAWDPSVDQTVTGYNLYYGGSSRGYTNALDATSATSISVSNLLRGGTYYFAATAYNAAGLESDYSVEVSYTVPSGTPDNVAPTLDPIDGVVVNQDCGPHTVILTGISSGSPTENQTLAVSAFSSHTALVPHPAVSYTSPNTTATLTFTPAAGAYGVCTITVSVYDGGAVSNTTIRSFTITVLQAPPPVVNHTPTINPIGDLAIDENAGLQTVNLTGITPGAGDSEPVAVTAVSSDLALIPAPGVTYSSPSTTGVLSFTPAANRTGSARITVTVDDGQSTNNLFSQSFNVTVRPAGGGTNITNPTTWTLWRQSTDGTTAALKMDGTNLTKTTRLNVGAVGTAWKMVGNADFDQDGNTDVLWQHTDTSLALWLMNETNFSRGMRLGSGPVGQGWRVAATADVNGDGLPDIVFQHTSGTTAAWLMDRTNCTDSIRLNAPLAGSGWRLAAVRDFDRDGHPDLLWQNNMGVLSLWLMDGTNCLSHFRLSTPVPGQGWNIVGAADLTGSGGTDLLWQNDNGRVSCWRMDGTNRVGGGPIEAARVSPGWRVMGPK